MPTLRHHGVSPLSANISSASPTCRRSLTSLLSWPDSLRRMALEARKLVLVLCAPNARARASPRGELVASLPRGLAAQLPLLAGSCYCRGSDDDESRFRCRYTSVP